MKLPDWEKEPIPLITIPDGEKYNGRDWQMVEKRLSNYPRYQGYGLKCFP